MVSFPASSEQVDSAYSPSRIPASPTARRQASGKAHPTPLDLSSPIASASAPLALDSPPRTMDSSLSPRMLTPTRTIPSSAESQPGAAQLRTETRLASFSASSLSNGHGAPPSRPSVLGYNVSRRGSSLQQQQQAGGPSPTGAMSNTRFLLTVIPPSHLPHDPPHPKSNPNCSGYGPPEHFKYVAASSQLFSLSPVLFWGREKPQPPPQPSPAVPNSFAPSQAWYAHPAVPDSLLPARRHRSRVRPPLHRRTRRLPPLNHRSLVVRPGFAARSCRIRGRPSHRRGGMELALEAVI